MKNNGTGAELQNLLRENGNLCVSIIFPANPVASQRIKDKITLDKKLEEANSLIDAYAKKQKLEGVDKLKKKLRSLYEKIDFSQAKEGAGIYVSGKIGLLKYFDFPVKEKVIVGASFQVRDLLFQSGLSKEYYTLMLSMNGIHLFRCSVERFEEIKDGNFPKKFADTFEYEKPSRGNKKNNAVRNPEGDKSVKVQKRMETFFRSADHKLSAYLSAGSPLFVAGVKKDIAIFMQVSSHGKSVAGKIEGNFEHGSLRKLEQTAWKKMQALIQSNRKKELKKLEEAPDSRFAMGIRDAWEETYEGKGLELFVEKDYSKTAFAGETPGKISLRTSPSKKNRIIRDAVDDLVEMVLSKNGRVQLFENGDLEKYDRVALLKRY
ncbi:MAG: hypothetical protein FD123_982 [Bacteroidetes bacterium]|nr:MAG: hypothetical protein FD123_982 [Bacteroidota bacterium]